mmetsp:Transcript_44763/g.136606  ORF Transcript_44763/g.136606 Transcript_44763/m.136606 type:complete len:135 (-) Transcript_44763:102-506(-)
MYTSNAFVWIVLVCVLVSTGITSIEIRDIENWREQVGKDEVDPRVVDDVFNLYSSIVLPNSGKVTRKLIEWTVNKDANEEIAEGEKWASIQDLRYAYNLILDDKHTRDHTVELKQTKSRFSIGSWLQRARKSLT